MNRYLKILSIISVFLFIGAATAMAAPLTTVNPGSEGASSTLTTIISDFLTSSGGGTYARQHDDYDEFWLTWSTGATVTSLAAYGGQTTQTLGYISGGSLTNLFSVGTGSSYSTQTASFISTSSFNWAITTTGSWGNYVWSSDVSSNYDLTDHMVTYYITSGAYTGSWVIGFEDIPGSDSGFDGDYNDLVVLVQNAYPDPNPVPIPSAVILFGSGIISLMGIRRFRR